MQRLRTALLAIAALSALAAPAAALSVPLLPPAVSWPADTTPVDRGCANPSTSVAGVCGPRS